MKNFLSFFSPKNLGEIAQALWTRFPIPAVLVLANAGLIWYQVNNPNALESDMILRVIMTLIVTLFLSVGIAIFGESHSENKYVRWMPVLPILYGIGFYFSIRYMDTNSGFFNDDIVLFILHLVGFIAWIFFAPFLLRRAQKEKDVIQYTNYFTQVAWASLMSGLVWGAVMALGSIAIGAVGTLFDLNALINEWKMYENWAVTALALAAPLYGLMHLPRKIEVREREYDTNKFFAFVIRFIVIPFVTLYFCILYAYSVKVLLNISDWPKWEVSWLVIGFSIFGYLGYIFSKSYEEEHITVWLYRRLFPIVVIPQIPMLGYAILLRINQYDLTMNRYFVVIFGIWLTIISLYFVFNKVKSLTVIPATLTVITLLISVGPWWVYQLPLNRQYSALIKNLETAWILNNGIISKSSDSLDPALENSIYSGIEYVCGFEKCARIQTLFASVLTEANKLDEKNWIENPYNKDKPYIGMNRWTVLSAVTQAINIQWRETLGINDERKYLTYGSQKSDIYDRPLNVAGYDTLYMIRGYYPGDTGTVLIPEYVMINVDKEELTLKEKRKETIFSLREINAELLKKYNNSDNNTLNSDDLTFVLEAENRSIKLIFQAYSFKNPKFIGKDREEYANIIGYALVN